MVRLDDHLARRRLLYPSPLISAPSVMVIDLPREYRGPSLSLGRFYAVIIEAAHELDELEEFLAAPRPNIRPPDLFDRRPSALWSASVLISRYDPPAPGWPWVCVSRWPEAMATTAAAAGISMARGCYTMEMFATCDAMDEHCSTVLHSLAANQDISIRTLAADTLPMAGNA